MDLVRTHRLARARMVLVHGRRLALTDAWKNLLRYRPIDYLVPQVQDISEFPVIQWFLGAPDDVVVDSSVFMWALSGSVGLIKCWREKAFQAIYSKFRMALGPLLAGFSCEDRFRLAVCVFSCVATGGEMRCQSSAQPMWYPQFLDRLCEHSVPGVKENTLVDAATGLGDYCDDKWSVVSTDAIDTVGVYSLEFDGLASRVTRDLLVACSVDPDSATVEVVEEEDPRVVCLLCRPSPQVKRVPVYSWRHAVCGVYAFVQCMRR